jgi:hypothetical protein
MHVIWRAETAMRALRTWYQRLKKHFPPVGLVILEHRGTPVAESETMLLEMGSPKDRFTYF